MNSLIGMATLDVERQFEFVPAGGYKLVGRRVKRAAEGNKLLTNRILKFKLKRVKQYKS